MLDISFQSQKIKKNLEMRNTTCLLCILHWEWFPVTAWKQSLTKNVQISTWISGLVLTEIFSLLGMKWGSFFIREMWRSFTHMSLMALSKRAWMWCWVPSSALPWWWHTGLNEVQIRGVTRAVHDSDLLLHEQGHHLLAGVTWGAVLENIDGSEPFHPGEELLLHNLHVVVDIHGAFGGRK